MRLAMARDPAFGKHQRPIFVPFDGLHEGVAHQHRQIEMAQPARTALGIGEGNNVGMIAPQRRHHCAAAGPGGLDGGAHGVPDIHE
jgi:hypothetical protein